MEYTLIVHASPYAGQGSRSALNFANAVLGAGHQLVRVFFYHDGVLNGLASRVMPQDEDDVAKGWQQISEHDGVELAVCIASALRRGVLNDEEAARYERSGATMDPAFSIVGLGQLIDAIHAADRTITFAD